MPLVSVLLPVRDAAPWLRASLASLARQTLTDHEVIAVDDGSRDDSRAILEEAADRDPRIRVFATGPRGLPAALDLAFAQARGPLLARHDADDLSHRTRFALQVAHLEAVPSDDVVGSQVRLFPALATGAGMRRWQHWHNALLTHEAMRHESLIDSPIAHGSVMMRREVLARVQGWREHGWAEDLDLWLRLFEAGARFAKLARPLYGWRQHTSNSTHHDARYSRENFMALKIAALDRGFLAGGRRATLIGVGTSLLRWHTALGSRLAAFVEQPRPPLSPQRVLEGPLLIALISPEARERWRIALSAQSMREGIDFIFIA